MEFNIIQYNIKISSMIDGQLSARLGLRLLVAHALEDREGLLGGLLSVLRHRSVLIIQHDHYCYY